MNTSDAEGAAQELIERIDEWFDAVYNLEVAHAKNRTSWFLFWVVVAAVGVLVVLGMIMDHAGSDPFLYPAIGFSLGIVAMVVAVKFTEDTKKLRAEIVFIQVNRVAMQRERMERTDPVQVEEETMDELDQRNTKALRRVHELEAKGINVLPLEARHE